MRFLIFLFYLLCSDLMAQSTGSIDLSPNAFTPTNGFGSSLQCLKTDGVSSYSWQACGGGGGTPGGAPGAIQFNSAGSFGGDASNLFWDITNFRLGIGTGSPGVPLDVTGPPAPTGTISSVGTAVSGSGTNFSSVFKNGDYIIGINQSTNIETVFAQILMVNSPTSITLNSAFQHDLPAGSLYLRVGEQISNSALVVGGSVPHSTLTVNAPNGYDGMTVTGPFASFIRLDSTALDSVGRRNWEFIQEADELGGLSVHVSPSRGAVPTTEVMRFSSNGLISALDGEIKDIQAAGGGGLTEGFRAYNNATAAVNNGSFYAFSANQTGGTEELAALFAGILTDVTAGASKGALIFGTAVNGSSSEHLRLDAGGHVEYAGTTPGSLTAGCGTGAVIVGNDMAGRITIGGTPGNNCQFSFANPWTNAPICSVANEVSLFAERPTASTTTLIISNVAYSTGALANLNASDNLVYSCKGFR